MITAYVGPSRGLFTRKSDTLCRSIDEALERFPCERLRIEIAPGTYTGFYVPTGRTVEIVGTGAAGGVVVNSGRGANSICGTAHLRGIVLRGSDNWGVLDITGGSATLTGCTVVTKKGGFSGREGAIRVKCGSLTMSACRVIGDIVLDNSTADIRRSRVNLGTAYSWIQARNSSRATVDHATFIERTDSAQIHGCSTVRVGKTELNKQLPPPPPPPHPAEVIARAYADDHAAKQRAAEVRSPALAGTDWPVMSSYRENLVEDISDDMYPRSARVTLVDDGHNSLASTKGSELDVLAELDQLIGLTSVKEHFRAMAAMMTVGAMRREAGLPSSVASSHLVFAGPPGTGKTSVARLYGRLLAALGMLRHGTVTEISRVDLVGVFQGQTARYTRAAFKRAAGGVLLIDEAHTLAPDRADWQGHDLGTEAIQTLLKLMEDHRNDVAVIVTGPVADMHRFLAADPGLASRFPRTILFEPYTPEELTAICMGMAEAAGYSMAEDTHAAVEQHMRACRKPRSFGNGRYARDVIDHMIERHAMRIADLGDIAPSANELARLEPADLRGAGLSPLRRRAISAPNRDQGKIDSVLAALDTMVGLDAVKKHFRDTITDIDNAAQRHRLGLAAHATENRNILFLGPSGTGKTSIAQLYGQLLSALGVLPQGQVHKVTRADLVGKYSGETAIKTRAALEQARGGIVLIDDAYSLARQSGARWDAGREAVDELIGLIDDYADDTIIIAAGYPAEMKDFLGMNPGLASRFPHTLRFEPYSPEQLLAITTTVAAERDYDMTDETAKHLVRYYQDLHSRGDANAGNARHAHNILAAMITAQAHRVADTTGVATHRQLVPDDLLIAIERL